MSFYAVFWTYSAKVKEGQDDLVHALMDSKMVACSRVHDKSEVA